jgi:uroporphyrinogen-III decarboxylase
VGADHAAVLAGVPIERALRDPDALTEVLLHGCREYRQDLVVCFLDVTVEAEALGAAVEWPADAPPRVLDPPGTEALRVLDPGRDGRLPTVLEATRRLVAEAGVPVLTSLKGPFSLTALVAGFEWLLSAAVEEPARAREALAVATACQEVYVRAIVAAGGVPLIGDPFASGSVLGEAHFRDLARPGLAKLVRAAHDLGSPAAIHVCGDVRPVQGALLSVGADLYHLEHADFGAVVRSGAAVMGGVPTEVLLTGEEEVRQAVREALRAMPDRDRFVLSTACDVPTHAPPDLVRAMVREERGAV